MIITNRDLNNLVINAENANHSEFRYLVVVRYLTYLFIVIQERYCIVIILRMHRSVEKNDKNTKYLCIIMKVGNIKRKYSNR